MKFGAKLRSAIKRHFNSLHVIRGNVLGPRVQGGQRVGTAVASAAHHGRGGNALLRTEQLKPGVSPRKPLFRQRRGSRPFVFIRIDANLFIHTALSSYCFCAYICLYKLGKVESKSDRPQRRSGQRTLHGHVPAVKDVTE